MDIQEKWKEHPLYKKGVVEMVPIEWVWKYWGRDVSPQADLLDGTEVSIERLWEDIVENGMSDPLIMRVGVKNKMFRLEAGNHRIQALYTHDVKEVPVTAQVRAECGPHVGDVMTDATHNFDGGDEIIIDEITDEYMKPSEVFRSLQEH